MYQIRAKVWYWTEVEKGAGRFTLEMGGAKQGVCSTRLCALPEGFPAFGVSFTGRCTSAREATSTASTHLDSLARTWRWRNACKILRKWMKVGGGGGQDRLETFLQLK